MGKAASKDSRVAAAAAAGAAMFFLFLAALTILVRKHSSME